MQHVIEQAQMSTYNMIAAKQPTTLSCVQIIIFRVSYFGFPNKLQWLLLLTIRTLNHCLKPEMVLLAAFYVSDCRKELADTPFA
jgi:hypothetical protein